VRTGGVGAGHWCVAHHGAACGQREAEHGRGQAMSRRSTVMAVAALAALLTMTARWQGGRLWRAAYPHLPARVQSLPYRISAVLPGTQHTPEPLPTPRQVEALHTVIPTTLISAATSLPAPRATATQSLPAAA